jgi:hypothetical protein
VELVKSGNGSEAAALVKTNEGRDVMRQIRSAVEEVDQEEIRVLNARDQRASLLRSIFLVATIVAGLLAGAVAILVGTTLRRQVRELSAKTISLRAEMVERERAEAMLRQAQKMEALGQLTGGRLVARRCGRAST